jgi:hypothetical protein
MKSVGISEWIQEFFFVRTFQLRLRISDLITRARVSGRYLASRREYVFIPIDDLALLLLRDDYNRDVSRRKDAFVIENIMGKLGIPKRKVREVLEDSAKLGYVEHSLAGDAQMMFSGYRLTPSGREKIKHYPHL